MSSPYDAISTAVASPSPYDAISTPANSNSASAASVSTGGDVARSLVTGAARGVAAVGSLPNLAERGINYVSGKVGGPQIPASAMAPSSDDILKQVTDQRAANGIPDGGALYKPQTTAGKYAETIGSFLPGGEGGLARRAVQTVIPAATSETAGELTQGTPYEPYARAAGAVLGAVVGNPAAAGAIRSINAVSVGKGGPTLLNPELTAQTKLRAAIDADGGTDAAGQQIAARQASGSSNPALIDVGGNNVRRLVRAAASGGSGDAQNIATGYAGRVRANFQDTVLDHTAGLTPGNTTSATTLAGQLERNQGDVAQTNYQQPGGPYSQPAQVTPEMVDALQGPEGRGAISRAFTAARANRNQQQMAELQDLQQVASEQGGGRDPLTGRIRSIGDALGGLSAGSLDRVRIGMRDIGSSLAARGNNATAGGYFGRVQDIDTALDQTPGLQPARAVYRQMQASRDALDTGGGALSTPGNEYADQISRLASVGGPPNIGGPLQVGARQALVNKLETGADGATGAAKTLSQSARATANLGQTFGEAPAARYQAALGHEVSRVQNADFISPNTGSQTALRSGDDSLIAQIPTNKVEFLGKIIDTLRGRGATLTDAERAAIVRIGTSEANLRNLAARNPHLNSAAIAQIAATNNQGN